MIPWYRRLQDAEEILLSHPEGIPVALVRGDYVRSDLLAHEPPRRRSLFGDPVKGSRVPGLEDEGRDGSLVLRLPHQLGRGVRAPDVLTQINVVAVARTEDEYVEAARMVLCAVERCHVPARAVIAVPWPLHVKDSSVEIFTSGSSTEVEMAREAVAAFDGVTVFVDEDTDYGWLERRLASLPWSGTASEVPDVGWRRTVVDKGRSPDPFAGTKGPHVCVVVTAHNAPEVVFPCIDAILRRTKYPNYSLMVMDDASDPFTESALRRLPDTHGPVQIRVVRSDENFGYLLTANAALEASFSPGANEAPAFDYAVLINSDVMVTPGWLSGMVRCALREGASLVNPMCNNSAMISMPFPGQSPAYCPRVAGGRGYLDVAAALATISPDYPDAVTSVGQCLLIERGAWLSHGPFDHEVYGRGYGEECSLWAKVLDGGGVAKVADDTFVYHESHATHGADAKEAERVGVETFIEHHGDTYRRQMFKMRRWPQDTAAHRAIISSTRPRSLPVSFVTFDIGPWGGVYCILRLVQELAELGVTTSVAHLTAHENQFVVPFGPRLFRTRAGMREWKAAMGFGSGILVATHWYSAILVDEIVEENDGLHPMAFWQDREDFFKNPKGERVLDDKIIERYVAIKDRIVNAQWVAESAIQDLGAEHFVHIPVGVDTLLFHPSPNRDRSGPVRILSMWRPTTKRRGHERVAETFRRLRKKYGDKVSLELYGQPQSPPAECDVHHGWLSQRGVASLVRGVDIFLEPSDFQGFGLPGLEALSSGVALVSTDNQGIHEYGRSGLNCIIAADDELFFSAIQKLISDEPFRCALAEAGRQTAMDFDWRKIAERWVEDLHRIVHREESLSQFRQSIDSVRAASRDRRSILEGGQP